MAPEKTGCNNQQAAPVYCGESGSMLEYSAITDTLGVRLDIKRAHFWRRIEASRYENNQERS
jgi:hypothetical protein